MINSIRLNIHTEWGVSGLNCWRVMGPTLVLFLFYVSVSGMRPRSRLSSQPLPKPTPWLYLHVGSSILMVPPWVTASYFLAGNREADLKPTIFSSHTFPHFSVFLLLLTPSDIVPLSAVCWSYCSLIIICIDKLFSL